MCGKEKGAAMKFATITKSLVMGLGLLLASSAFAATKAQLHLHSSITINGTQLRPGDYKLEWDGTGPSVEVSIVQGKKVITKTTAKLLDLPSPYGSDAAVLRTNSDGTSSLVGVRFEGKKFGLDLAESSDGMQAGSSK
jgi:hypothetical protein